ISIPVMTGMGDLRNAIIIRSVQGAIAIDGAYGTLSEIAYTLGYNKPVVTYKSWDIPGVEHAETPEAAVDLILSLISE
ncbi:MAG: Rossmann fold nucleotide-binding protein, partial [Candidatus Marinimicrobia bacterium]|nr:Rossmann fold nucleotide-binding protein [Candidatus Neomarinimicrobiota bacterium]